MPGATSARRGSAGSAMPSHQWTGSKPRGLSTSVCQAIAASIAPAAPSACPVSGFVELAGVSWPTTSATARLSIESFWSVAVPCRLT